MNALRCRTCGRQVPSLEGALLPARCPKCSGDLVRPELPWSTASESGDLPRAFGPYRLLREIGRGVIGVVFEARHEARNATLALKIMRPPHPYGGKSDRLLVDRFVLDGKLNASMPPHPFLVTVHEAGIFEGTPYLTRDLVVGAPMTTWAAGPRCSLTDRVRLLRDVAVALHEVHLMGFVHQNLKPENLLVDSLGQPRVTDFCQSNLFSENRGLSTTALGGSRRRLAYLSPEQAMNQKVIDRRTDVYAIGMHLYETICGELPFIKGSAVSTLLSITEDPLPAPSKILLDLGKDPADPELERITLQALSRDPEHRPASALALAAQLNGWLAT